MSDRRPQAVKSGLAAKEEYDLSRREGPTELGPISVAISEFKRCGHAKSHEEIRGAFREIICDHCNAILPRNHGQDQVTW